MDSKTFVLGKAPFIRRADSSNINTKKIMFNFIIALVPLIIFAWYKNGIKLYLNDKIGFTSMIYPICFIIAGGLSSFFSESLFYLIALKEEDCFKKSFNNYSIIPGLMLSMILPINTPLWVLILGCIFSIIVSKMLFGGFGYNIFNPALVGYVFIMAAFYDVISNNGLYLNVQESMDIVSGVTPLSDFKNVLNGSIKLDEVIANHGGLLNMFIGYNSGSLAETSALLCIISYFFLVFTRVIDFLTPLIFIITSFIFTYFVGAFIGYSNTSDFAMFNILNGGLMFSSVFMITEPVTSPKNMHAKYLYVFFIALISILLRFLSDYPEGVSTAILFMNMFSILLDNACAKNDVNNNKFKKFLFYFSFIIIGILVSIYTVIRILEVN